MDAECTPVKVKREKIDPEVEEKIKTLAAGAKQEPENDKINQDDSNTANGEGTCHSDDADSNTSDAPSSAGNEVEEDKKSIEPVKSSNEILTELFRVFNAAPPEELLDDKSLLKKGHKHKKRKKEKKKKLKKEKSDGERSDSDSGDSVAVSKELRHKHKKKKKHKSKENKDKEKTKEKSKDKHRAKEKSRDREKEKSRDIERYKTDVKMKEEADDRKHYSSSNKRHAEDVVNPAKISRTAHERSRDRDKAKDRDRDHGYNSFYNGCRERDREGREKERYRDIKIKNEPSDAHHHSSSRHKNYQKDGHISEISLSDEETYLKEHERTDDTSRRRFGHDAGHSRVHNNFYGSAVQRSRSRERERHRYRNDSDGPGSRRRRSRSHSNSRARELGIDKKRLLEIARKNAINMFKRGNLPGCADMSQEVKDKVLLKMRYGGRTVQDLTDFCKKISNGENLSDLSSDEESDVDKAGNTKAFHHPFQLKEREPIVMHIRNSTTIVPRKSEDQTKAITMQFPVSSGQQHRLTEAWVPVESKDALVPLPALPSATQSTNIFKAGTNPKGMLKNIFEKPMPQQAQQEPAFKAFAFGSVIAPAEEVAPAAAPTPTPAALTTPMVVPAPIDAIAAPTPVPPIATSSAAVITPMFVPDVPVPSAMSKGSIFSQKAAPNIDVSSIISKRLNAMRRLQDNPMDPEAIKMMYNSQKEMTCWASSKHLPGQFTGSTGANVLTMRELNSGPQVWARRDQLTSTQPVTGGMGMHLLQKMGWKPGEGLGREKTGSLQPLLLDVKLDKRGLVSKEDNGFRRGQAPKKQRANTVAQAQQQMSDKHPVCLLNELTSKRRWTPPLYTLVNEAGPSHSRMFMFSVTINGQIFTPTQASNTKKEAKLLAAKNCLQQMGILPA